MDMITFALCRGSLREFLEGNYFYWTKDTLYGMDIALV